MCNPSSYGSSINRLPSDDGRLGSCANNSSSIQLRQALEQPRQCVNIIRDNYRDVSSSIANDDSSLPWKRLQENWRWTETFESGGADCTRTGRQHGQPVPRRIVSLSRRMRIRPQFSCGRQNCQQRSRSSRHFPSTRSPRRRRRQFRSLTAYTSSSMMLCLLVLYCLCHAVKGFVSISVRRAATYATPSCFVLYDNANDNAAFDDDSDDDWKQPIGDGISDSEAQNSDVTSDLSWRVAKLRLEEQNTARFLKARPRFLPYDDCRKWVQAWSRWQTKEDWRYWISQGEKRNSYIPSMPDQYYKQTGDWRGWNHFLGIVDEDDTSAFQ